MSGKSLGEMLPLDVFLDMIENSMASLEDEDGLLAAGMLNLTKVESNSMQSNSQALPISNTKIQLQFYWLVYLVFKSVHFFVKFWAYLLKSQPRVPIVNSQKPIIQRDTGL